MVKLIEKIKNLFKGKKKPAPQQEELHLKDEQPQADKTQQESQEQK